MKKLLILSLLFLSCSFSSPYNYYATTWAGTASNSGITRTAMNNLWNTYGYGGGGYYPWKDGGSLPSNSLQLITRAYFEANYETIGLGGSYLKNTSKTSGQILVKSDIGIVVILYTRTGVCTATGSPTTVYLNSTLTTAYTDAAQTTLFNGGGTMFYTGSFGGAEGGSCATCSDITINSSGVVTALTFQCL